MIWEMDENEDAIVFGRADFFKAALRMVRSVLTGSSITTAPKSPDLQGPIYYGAIILRAPLTVT